MIIANLIALMRIMDNSGTKMSRQAREQSSSQEHQGCSLIIWCYIRQVWTFTV